jgi:ferrous iron transport protein B
MLGYFPRNSENDTKYKGEMVREEMQYNDQKIHMPGNDLKHLQLLENEKNEKINNLLLRQKSEQQSKSFIGMIGRGIEPVMKPLGFDWKMSVCILSGLAAKEVVVSTMGVLYQAEDSKQMQSSLITKLQSQTNAVGQKVFTPLVAFCFMLFILIYFPCIGVIAAIKRESSSWKWAALTVIYTTGAAWLLAFTVFQAGRMFF